MKKKHRLFAYFCATVLVFALSVTTLTGGFAAVAETDPPAPDAATAVDAVPVDVAPVDDSGDVVPVDTIPVDDSVVVAPVDTAPVDTVPVDTDPVDTDPVDTAPVDTDPVDTDPVDTPVDTPVDDPDVVDTDPQPSEPDPITPTEREFPYKDDAWIKTDNQIGAYYKEGLTLGDIDLPPLMDPEIDTISWAEPETLLYTGEYKFPIIITYKGDLYYDNKYEIEVYIYDEETYDAFVSPNELDFSSVEIVDDDDAISREVTFTNAGSVDYRDIGAYFLSGDTEAFAVLSDYQGTQVNDGRFPIPVADVLNPGKSVSFKVRPVVGLEPGSYEATLAVTYWPNYVVLPYYGASICYLDPATELVNVKITVAPLPAPDYSYAIDPEGAYEFPSKWYGYDSANDQLAKTFALTNTGNQWMDNVKVEIGEDKPGDNPDAFTADLPAGNGSVSIMPGEQLSFPVYPVNGLTPGTYTAQVKVSWTTYGNVIEDPVYPPTVNVLSAEATPVDAMPANPEGDVAVDTHVETIDISFTVNKLPPALPPCTNFWAYEGTKLKDVTATYGWTFDEDPDTSIGEVGYQSHPMTYDMGEYYEVLHENITFEVVPNPITQIVFNPGAVDLGSVKYDTLAEKPYQTPLQFVTATNTGNYSVYDSTISLSGGDTKAFEILEPDYVTEVPEGADAYITVVDEFPNAIYANGGARIFGVRPKADLKPGTYTATLTVSGTASIGHPLISNAVFIPVSYDTEVTFTVEKADYPMIPVYWGADVVAYTGMTLGQVELPPTWDLKDVKSISWDAPADTPLDTVGVYKYSYTVYFADEELYNPMTFTVNVTVTEQPVWSYTVTPTSLDFGSQEEGYGAQKAKIAKLENTGNQPLAGILVYADEVGQKAFDISYSGGDYLDGGKNGEITVTPKTGLAPGTYTGKIYVTGNFLKHALDNYGSLSANLSQELTEITVKFTVTEPVVNPPQTVEQLVAKVTAAVKAILAVLPKLLSLFR